MSRALPLLLALFVPAARADDAPKKPAPTPARTFAVTAHRDLAYFTGADADPVRHKLDLYIPEGARDFPVLVFVHGGTWQAGRKERYAGVGRLFARHGIGNAVINYRLSPQVKHPAHVQDVARAVAWVHANIAKYGGRPDRLFLSGHSAGGHLVALLTADEQYLKAEGLSAADVRGVLAMSGVYVISPVWVFEKAFGDDVAGCRDASPLTHVRAGLPPFALFYAERDFKYLGEMAELMSAGLKRAGVTAEVCRVPERNHMSIVFLLGRDGDPVAPAMLEFIEKYGK
jgi:acetyl esterase/lipase